MNKEPHINGIILSGGGSRRMGQDKGLLDWKGKSFIAHCAQALQPLVHKCILVSDHQQHGRFNMVRVADIYKNAGPMAGLHAGLSHSTAKHNLVVSCDTPAIDTATLGLLINGFQEDMDAACLSLDGQLLPLLGLYKHSCLPLFERELKAGRRKLQDALSKLRVRAITLSPETRSIVQNINTRRQYNALRYESNC